MIYTLGVLALMLAGTLSVFSVLGWSRPDPRIKEIQDHRGAIQTFRAQSSELDVHLTEVSPLSYWGQSPIIKLVTVPIKPIRIRFACSLAPCSSGWAMG